MFEAGVGVEIDPEFPPDGGDPPERIPPRLPRIGAVFRLTAPGAEPWDIAIGAPNWWRTPVPRAIAFLSDGAGYVVDVDERRVLVEVQGAVRVRQDAHHDLVLLVTESDITAIGANGIAWRTKRLAYDDLKVVESDSGRIVCRGFVDIADLSRRIHSEISIDPFTGAQLSGPTFGG